jgi:acetylornithine/succinyldiaminopimelate/putrescine aminotransferase
LRAICDEEGILLIFDEVQTGLGRTGKLFAYEHYGVEPDIITLAKGLGGGIPVGAMMCREEVAHGFVKGSHATTFGGNPVVATAGLAVLEVLDEENLLKNSEEMGAHLRKGLETLSSEHVELGEVRGLGLMLAIEYAGDSAALMSQSRVHGLLHNTAGGGDVLRFLPPLIICKKEIDEGLIRLEKALHSVV